MSSVSNRLRRDAPLAYGLLQALTGIADGLWQGAYAWFLSAKLGFTAPEVAVVIGAQFILQIILEVPSGTWADRGATRRILVASYLAFFVYCLIYAAAGGWASGEGMSKPLLLGLAVLAEACFGVGTAFLSGTLDAWVAERERAASREQDVDFANRLRRVHSISELWGQTPSALVGTAAFMIATEGYAYLPWLLGGAVYLVAAGIVLVAIGQRETPEVATASTSLAENIGRFTSRAVSYLQEQPETLRLFIRSAVAYMPFYATQVFWIPFLAQTLFVGQGDALALPLDFTIPLVATLWGAGELSRALGGSLFANRASHEAERREPTRRMQHVAFGMFGYAVGIALQLAAVLVDWHEVQCFACGYLLSRFCEGRVRRDLAVVMDQSILSDRATLRSLDSLIKALVGLIYITLVGALMYADPTIGYLTICATAVVAGIQLVLLARESNTEQLPPHLRPRWHHGNSLTIAFVAALLILLVAVGTESRPLWTFLNRLSAKGDIVFMEQTESRTTSANRAVAALTWDIWSVGAHDVGCRVPVRSSRELWNNDLGVDSTSEGGVRATFRSINGAYYLEFKLLARDAASPNKLTARLSEHSSRHIQCFRLATSSLPHVLAFDERGVVPVSVSKMNATPSSSLMIYVELVIGVSVVFTLLALAGADVRRRLQEVLQTVPGTLLDQARDNKGTRPDLIRTFNEGLPEAGFEPFDKFLRNLGASCLVLGGYTSDRHAVAELAIHKYGILWAEKTVRNGRAPLAMRIDDLSTVLPEWLGLVRTAENTSDDKSRTLASHPEYGVCYAASAVVLRSGAPGTARRGRVGGFAALGKDDPRHDPRAAK